MAHSKKSLLQSQPSLFEPSVIRSIANQANGSVALNLLDATKNTDLNIEETGSFRYDLAGAGLKSTQQINIDWSKFENHTFFNSAQVKVNVAFDRFQNNFPFDGTKKEVEAFIDSLTGYEKYVYDGYPKNKGYLFFSGTNGEGFGGTYVIVKDIAGAAYPHASRKLDGATILNPASGPITLEFWFYAPGQTNDNQVIFDKHSGSMGFMAVLNATGSSASGSATFWLTSGSVQSSLPIVFSKGRWNHFAWAWNRTPGHYKVYAYLNGNFYASSSMPVEFGVFNVHSDAYVGSGSALGTIFVPNNTLSGALDELRIWHSVRSQDEIRENMEKSCFASPELKLYYKFNEPSGSNSNLVIDSSSNSLHGKLSTSAVALGVRNIPTASLMGKDPVIYESLAYCPILFPGHKDVVKYRSDLLVSASIYDASNPNLITKLVPKHYLLEGQEKDALTTEEGPILTDLSYGTDPRTTKLGSTQVLLLMLYTWAKFFDELKLYTQAFTDLNFVDYKSEDTVPDQFLLKLAKSQGIDLPPIFVGSSLEQYIDANNIQDNISKNTFTLQYIQNQIWRRILVNLRDVVASKGTIHAVKSFIRSTGIDPDNNFRIREYGGPNKRALSFSRDSRSEIASMLSFISGGLIVSPYLSASKSEPGYPFSGGGAPAMDHYLTSGSFTYEAIYKFPYKNISSVSQSLVRFCVTGSTFGNNKSGGVVLNLVAVSGSKNQPAAINLYGRPGTATDSPYFTLTITGADIFDGDKWYLSVGRIRNDDIQYISSSISSSYFLRVAKANYGNIIEFYQTSSYFNEFAGTSAVPVFQNRFSTSNASGSFFVVGSQSIDTVPNLFLNDTVIVTEKTARATNFSGKVSNIRFWSKHLSDKEWREHVRDFRSKGVLEPLTNFSFVTNISGSWERLRIDATTDQETTSSNNSGNISIFDFSQNNFHLSGTNFPVTSSVIKPERFYYTYLSPKFDEASTIEKVRIRSFLDYNNVLETPWAETAPVYEIPRSEQPTDTTKFTIDYSVVEALNQDIINIFATLDSLDNVLGSPELLFTPDYPGLENLRKVYFNRLTDKINLKSFFEFYKWFDTNIGTFVAQLIPRKTKFLGTNFVLESHALERSKLEYFFHDIYLGESNRNGLKDTILLQLFVGEFARY
jgi:hypothetical protein